jgi:hypothetical protein
MNKLPRACFKISPTPSAEVTLPSYENFLVDFEDELKEKFNSDKPFGAKLLSVSAFVLQENNTSFTVCLSSSSYGNDEWILMIGHLDSGSILDLILRRESKPHTAELISISKKIHSVLLGITNISCIRWYFQEKHTPMLAVATPEELCWV